MKLSTRARYGTRALLDIALVDKDGPVPLKDIADRQQISLQYLEQIIAPLVRGGIVKSSRGVKGGVWLNRPPDEIKLGEVVRLLTGSLAPVECVDDLNYCDRSAFCATRDVLEQIKEALESILEATTLQDLVEKQLEKERPVYWI